MGVGGGSVRFYSGGIGVMVDVPRGLRGRM